MKKIYVKYHFDFVSSEHGKNTSLKRLDKYIIKYFVFLFFWFNVYNPRKSCFKASILKIEKKVRYLIKNTKKKISLFKKSCQILKCF